MRKLTWLSLPLGAAAILTGPVCSAAQPQHAQQQSLEPFSEARLYFELNNTDGDLGLHGVVDGDEWKRLEVEDPSDVHMIDVFVRGRLRPQGLTEISFESGEPSFDELAPQAFFSRFPEGTYEIEGITLDGRKLRSPVELSHVMPAPAGNIQISGVNAAANCDVENLPSVQGPVVIRWDPVQQSHPTIGKAGAVTVEHYELVIEREEPTLLVFSVELPPELTALEIPADFIKLGDEFKLEIITRATNGNQTAVESCFEVE